MVDDVGHVMVEVAVWTEEELPEALHPVGWLMPHIFKVETAQSSHRLALHRIPEGGGFGGAHPVVGVTVEDVPVEAVSGLLGVVVADVLPVDEPRIADDVGSAMRPVLPIGYVAFFEPQPLLHLNQPLKGWGFVDDGFDSPVVVALKYGDLALGILFANCVLDGIQHFVTEDVFRQEARAFCDPLVIFGPSRTPIPVHKVPQLDTAVPFDGLGILQDRYERILIVIGDLEVGDDEPSLRPVRKLWHRRKVY